MAEKSSFMFSQFPAWPGQLAAEVAITCRPWIHPPGGTTFTPDWYWMEMAPAWLAQRMGWPSSIGSWYSGIQEHWTYWLSTNWMGPSLVPCPS
jgi:hypothetical protein